MSVGRARALAAVLLSAALLSCASAHTWQFAGATAEFDEQAHFTVWLRFDTPAYLLNDLPERVSDADMAALADGPAAALDEALGKAAARLQRGFRVEADGVEIAGSVAEFPTRAQVEEAAQSGRSPRFPIMLDAAVKGRVPVGARRLAVRFPEALGRVMVSFELPDGTLHLAEAPPGRFTEAVAVSFAESGGGAQPPERGGGEVMRTYLALGYEHILPGGLDHILFVLGIFLLGSRIGGLLWQVTAFTVAHSITLGLSLYGVVRLPSAVVEPIIAASIAVVCIENLFATRVTPWRVAVIFGFGLVHGLGFAGVLQELGLPRDQFLTALVAFNAGVELGQISVLALAFLAVGWWRDRPWYRTRIAMPASVAIACVAIWWTVQRL